MLKIFLSLLLFASFMQATSITAQKDTFLVDEPLTFAATDMSGDSTDWIGVYPVGASNAWENVRSWKWTRWRSPKTSGTLTIHGLPAGEYEVRAFFHNSYIVEAIDTFTVAPDVQNNPVNISTNKEVYAPNESITITLSNMLGDSQDWIGIYPVGSSNSWSNVRSWKWTGGIVNGTITLPGVAAGEYEARAFYENSYHLETIDTFTVEANNDGNDDGKAKIFIIGDSTVHNTSQGEMGWGSKLGTYMNYAENASNRARSGASSKSYKYESSSHHDWTYTKNLINQADITDGAYLLIQFGHNDAKSGYLHTEPGRYNSYYNELKVFVDQARDLGVTPVLITPVSRQYVGSRTHGQYPQTMKYLAEDENVLLLDLEYKSYLEFKEYDSDAALQNVFSYDDGTHFNPTGAGIVAGWVKELACQENQTLCNQFK